MYLYFFSSIIFSKPTTYTYKLPISDTSYQLQQNETISLSVFHSYKPMKSKKIPPILFRITPFELDSMPIEIKKVLLNSIFINKNYTQVHVSDEEGYAFINQYFPKCISIYKKIIPGAFKSDILRLCLLYYYGGIYNDNGHSYVKAFDSFIQPDEELVLVNDVNWLISSGYHNAFMACYPRHPIILHMIYRVMYNITNSNYGICALDVTGPKAVARAFNNFFGKNDEERLSLGKHILSRNNKKYSVFILHLKVNFTDTQKRVITDKNKQVLIKCKCKGYNDLFYKNRKKIRWETLWIYGLIYHN